LEGPYQDRKNTRSKRGALILGPPSRGGTFRQHSKRLCHWQRGRLPKDPVRATPSCELDGEYSELTEAQCRGARRRA
jgi:hypothetical protein